MDATQILDFEDEETDNEDSEKTVAFLKVLPVGDFPETLFPIHEGENTVGRLDSCSITIPLQSVSKKHACIDVHGKNHLIYDYNSRNKTWRNKMFLKPRAFYELVHEVELMFADVKCQYLFVQPGDMTDKEIPDSGSETGSETMLPQATGDEEKEDDGKKFQLTSSPNKVQLDEAIERYLDNEPTQSYTFNGPTQSYTFTKADESSPVFCAETDSETEDERETKDAASGMVEASSSEEQTQQYSPGEFGNEPKIEDTAPYAPDTLPDTLITDTIPETPFTQPKDVDSAYTLKRAVDVRVDKSRRISAGNTLAYGLATLESPNSTRESFEISGSESAKEGLAVVTPKIEIKDKLHFESPGEESPKKSGVRYSNPVSNEYNYLDDLATQPYPPLEVPESPEFLQPDTEPPVENTGKVTEPITPEDGTPGERLPQDETAREDIPQGKVSEFETSDGNMSEGKTLGNKTDEGKVSEGENTWGKVPEGEIPEGEIPVGEIPVGDVPNDDMLEETQAYGLAASLKVEDKTVETQAYGLTVDSRLETGDELATQAYGLDEGMSVRVPERSSVFKVPGAMNTQDLNEADGKLEVREDSVKNEAVEAVGNQDANETSESSDGNLPSLAKMMGMKSDGDSDFKATRQTSKKKLDTKSTSESTQTPVKKSSCLVIEGENALSTEKRCYLECPAAEGEEPGARNRPARGRKGSTTRRGKVQQGTLEDTTGVATTPVREDRVNEEATSSSRNENIPEDKDEQRATIAVKRGKGRPPRGRKAASTTRSSRTRGKKNETVAEEDVEEDREEKSLPRGRSGARRRKISDDKKEDVEEDREEKSLPRGRSSARRRKISDDKKEDPKEGCKNEVEISKDEMGIIDPSEEKVNISGDEEDSELFKLQVSAVDTPDTDDFLPDKKPARHGKRSLQRGREGLKREPESNDESETTKAVNEEVTTSMKSKRTIEYSTSLNKDGQAELPTVDDIVGEPLGETSIYTPPEDKHDTESREQMEEDLTGGVGGSSQKTASEEQGKMDVTPVVRKRRGRPPKGAKTSTKTSRNARIKVDQELEHSESKDGMKEQANIVNETELEGGKTTRKGRGRKRKSSENISEGVQQSKGTGKKSRRNTKLEEENAEIDDENNDDLPLSRETTDSVGEDAFLSLPSSSLSTRTSSVTSSTPTSSSNVSRSVRKRKQPENVENESVCEPPTPRMSSSARKQSTLATPSSARGGRSRSAKKTKQDSVSDEDSGGHLSSVKIIFTGLQDDAVSKAKKMVQVLGGKVVARLEECTHLVTDKVRRTVKLLCAVSRGIPVVNMSWLDASRKSKSFVDCSDFILRDQEAEKKFSFSMERSLELAGNARLLEGFKLHVTPHIRPPPQDMKEIIKSARGEILTKMPTSRDDNVIVLSCDEDKALCTKAHIEHAYTAELLLTGILRQELDLEQHKLTFNAAPEATATSRGRRRR